MNLWQARQQSLEWLTTELAEQNSLVYKGFELLDRCITLLNQKSKSFGDEPNGRFVRIVNITLAKSRNLLLGSYSLLLDAIAQEAGALLRLLLEAYELLVYFRLEPTRVDQAIDEKLPSAGVIAKKIEGKFKDLRDSLNTNASHISFSQESAKHLIDYQTSEIRTVQIQSVDVLKTNLIMLNGTQVLIVAEAIRCLEIVGYSDELLLSEYDAWLLKGIKASKFVTDSK